MILMTNHPPHRRGVLNPSLLVVMLGPEVSMYRIVSNVILMAVNLKKCGRVYVEADVIVLTS
jgi:hypothetical protein